MKKLIASAIASAMLFGAAYAAPECYREDSSMIACAADSNIDPLVIGEWYTYADDIFVILKLSDDGTGFTFIGNEYDYLLGNYDDGMYAGGYYMTKNGKIYTSDTTDYSYVEGVDYRVSGDEIYINDLVMTKYITSDTFMLGDPNGDGKIDSSDASLVLSAYAAIATGHAVNFSEAMRYASDIDGDGAVDAYDASLILSYYAYKATGGTKTLEQFIKK